jgi:hypothetical protein
MRGADAEGCVEQSGVAATVDVAMRRQRARHLSVVDAGVIVSIAVND